MAQRILTGIPVSGGINSGKAVFINRNNRASLPRYCVVAHALEQEAERLESAFSFVEKEVEEARSKLPDEWQQHRLVFDSHLMILRDPKLKKVALENVRKLHANAEWALEKAVDEIASAFAKIGDEYLKSRIQDVYQVADRVQNNLLGCEMAPQDLAWGSMIMAYDLTPADTVEFTVGKVKAFCTVRGGKTSHTGILARSMDIPALVGVNELERYVNTGDFVIVDGFKGRILVNPSEDETIYYQQLESKFETYKKRINSQAHLPAETKDGFQVKVLANIELREEVTQVRDKHSEGVGLFRTEYAYLNRADLPDEEELVEVYSEVASLLAPQKVVFRTLDLGADKTIARIGSLEEDNPALGLRAIRFCLKHPAMFQTQLRAILRASMEGEVSIMFPMISGLSELREAKAMLLNAMNSLKAEGLPFKENIPIGIMIELPGAVMIAEILAKEVDFFSIGTNDLIQYSLGIDRTNQNVSYLYQPLHPAVLRSIKHVVDAAHEAGIEVSLCGEVASDPYCIPILMGMQIDCISLTPQAIPGIKSIIRQTHMEDCHDLLKEVIQQHNVGRINMLVKDKIFEKYPEELLFYSSLLEFDDSLQEKNN